MTEAAQLQSQWDLDDTIRGGDVERDEVAALRRADRDDAIRRARERALERQEESTDRTREVPVEHRAVVRMDDDGDTREAGRDAPDETRLREVSVNDRRPESTEQSDHADKGDDVP